MQEVFTLFLVDWCLCNDEHFVSII